MVAAPAAETNFYPEMLYAFKIVKGHVGAGYRSNFIVESIKHLLSTLRITEAWVAVVGHALEC